MRSLQYLVPAILLSSVLPLASCTQKTPEPDKEEARAKSAESSASSTSPTSLRTPRPVPGGDPLQGKFSMEDALRDLPGKGKLSAVIDTDLGKLTCELYADRAPLTVANFVGLARGIRPFEDPRTHTWTKRPAYDGTTFHRVVPGFMIQGGDPTGTGAGEPGYVVPDEIWTGASHDRRGLLCMANRGPNTNGMQFFITDGPAPHLDRGYTIFGSCTPDATIQEIARTPRRGPERPVQPPKILTITIERRG